MKDATMLARISLLQEENVIKFVNRATIMRPAYFVAVDPRHQLVILSIRGTQTISDVITDLSSDSEHAEKLDGEPVHYGSVEAARWFLRFEVGTLRRCLTENQVSLAKDELATAYGKDLSLWNGMVQSSFPLCKSFSYRQFSPRD